MNNRMKKMAKFALPAIMAGGVLSGLASAAGASTGSADTAERASSTSFTLSNTGDSALVPTWGFGGTNLCTTNFGDSYNTLKVQSKSPFAGPEYVTIAPEDTECINRWWFAVPVTVTNMGSPGETKLKVIAS